MSSVFDDLIIVKRSGQRVSFNGTKIAIAIKNAFDSAYENYDETNVNIVYESVLKYIEKEYNGRKTINVEDIQDIIEAKLKENNFNDVYIVFNDYRLKRAASREVFTAKQQHKFVKSVEKLVLDVKNNNDDKPLNVLLNFGKTVANEFAKSYLIDSKYVRADEEGIISINNLNYYPLGIPSKICVDLSKMNIYSTKNYFDEILKIILGLKKESSGEINIPAIDYLFVSWVTEEFKKIFKNNLFKYLNYSGFIDFVNFTKIEHLILNNISTIEPDLIIFKDVIINDKIKKCFEEAYQDASLNIKAKTINKLKIFVKKLNTATYNLGNNLFSISLGTNTSLEGKLINECYLLVLKDLNYLENVTTIYKVRKNINLNTSDTNYHFLEIVAKLIADKKNIVISFQDTSYNKKYLSKDCKSEIEYFSTGERIVENITSENEVSTGRMIIASTSLNLARYGLKNQKDSKTFYENLGDTLDLIKNELKDTFELYANKNKENYNYIYKNNIVIGYEKLENKEKIRKALKNGVLNINLSGIMECALALNNTSVISNKEIDLSLDILNFIKKRCSEYIKDNKLNFSISETNICSVLRKFEAIDKSIYGKVDGITDKNNYSLINTILTKDNLGDRLKIEGKISSLLNGGYLSDVVLSKKSNYKKIIETIYLVKDADIGCARIRVG